jgi:hypothetical protein
MRSIGSGISRFRVWSFGPSRNDNHQTCALVLTARSSPELCQIIGTLNCEGAGKAGRRRHPLHRVRCVAKGMHTGLTGTAKTSRLSPRNGFTAYFAISPGNGLSCPRCHTTTGRRDRRQGRGARTTRLHRTLPAPRRVKHHLTQQASIATRTTLRDDRETSLMAARAGAGYSLICLF